MITTRQTVRSITVRVKRFEKALQLEEAKKLGVRRKQEETGIHETAEQTKRRQNNRREQTS